MLRLSGLEGFGGGGFGGFVGGLDSFESVLPSEIRRPLRSRVDRFAEPAKRDIDLPILKRSPKESSASVASRYTSIKHSTNQTIPPHPTPPNSKSSTS